MNCLFCSKITDLHIIEYFPTEKCLKCEKLYIKKDNIEKFIKFYLFNSFKIDKKYKEYIISKLNDISLTSYVFLNKFYGDDKCLLFRQCKRKNCYVNKYNLNGFIFWYCNYIDYFCFYEKDLKKFLKKFVFKIKLEYNMKLIRNKVKALFVQEGVK